MWTLSPTPHLLKMGTFLEMRWGEMETPPVPANISFCRPRAPLQSWKNQIVILIIRLTSSFVSYDISAALRFLYANLPTYTSHTMSQFILLLRMHCPCYRQFWNIWLLFSLLSPNFGEREDKKEVKCQSWLLHFGGKVEKSASTVDVPLKTVSKPAQNCRRYGYFEITLPRICEIQDIRTRWDSCLQNVSDASHAAVI